MKLQGMQLQVFQQGMMLVGAASPPAAGDWEEDVLGDEVADHTQTYP